MDKWIDKEEYERICTIAIGPIGKSIDKEKFDSSIEKNLISSNKMVEQL